MTPDLNGGGVKFGARMFEALEMFREGWFIALRSSLFASSCGAGRISEVSTGFIAGFGAEGMTTGGGADTEESGRKTPGAAGDAGGVETFGVRAFEMFDAWIGDGTALSSWFMALGPGDGAVDAGGSVVPKGEADSGRFTNTGGAISV